MQAAELVARYRAGADARSQGGRMTVARRRTISDGEAAAAELVDAYRPLIAGMATRFAQRYLSDRDWRAGAEDLTAAGMVALLEVASTFKGGAPFEAYLRRALKPHMSAEADRIRTPLTLSAQDRRIARRIAAARRSTLTDHAALANGAASASPGTVPEMPAPSTTELVGQLTEELISETAARLGGDPATRRDRAVARLRRSGTLASLEAAEGLAGAMTAGGVVRLDAPTLDGDSSVGDRVGTVDEGAHLEDRLDLDVLRALLDGATDRERELLTLRWGQGDDNPSDTDRKSDGVNSATVRELYRSVRAQLSCPHRQWAALAPEATVNFEDQVAITALPSQVLGGGSFASLALTAAGR